ncbi:hypothetical protein NCG89_16825 [Spongiibacter taiwanensis]|uniref:hypothetical protein n=1 Tax=Spongiibacter taiwanensis TaxID=1748242 RepID=UPI0020364706|nr:hypothetical protein [Spongiibacter taiwanensis]USA43186.1 hypothetical protein NCG89_16825 [Spongiibacter taiwanensis]
MRKIRQIKLSLFFGFLLMMCGGTLADDYQFVVSGLEGQILDYNNGVLKRKDSIFSSELIMETTGGSATLNTGQAIINDGVLRKVSDQLTFLFQADLAFWVVSCYPNIGLALVSVHSDASKYGGARTLSYSGKCQAKKISKD